MITHVIFINIKNYHKKIFYKISFKFTIYKYDNLCIYLNNQVNASI